MALHGWMGSLGKNVQLVLKFFKAPFLVLHFSYRTLHWWPSRWWYYSALKIWAGIWYTTRIGTRSYLWILMLEKLNLFCLTGVVTQVPLIWKWVDMFFKKNNLLSLFMSAGFTCPSRFNYIWNYWNSLILAHLQYECLDTYDIFNEWH